MARSEIIAERKSPEHLKKRVMPCGVADIVESLCLPARTHFW
jgi:hypothetical protein